MTVKKIFLIDSIGAFLSAFFLGVVLVHFQEYIGMPRDVLVFLALLALGFCLYSLVCHFFVKDKWRPFLRNIAVVNTLYCLLTLGLIIYFFQSLTLLGLIYFMGEITVITALVFQEFRLISRTP